MEKNIESHMEGRFCRGYTECWGNLHWMIQSRKSGARGQGCAFAKDIVNAQP